MKLRKAVTIWGFTLSILFLLGNTLFSTFIIEDGFSALETRHVLDKLKTARNSLQLKIEKLDEFVWDWASWDDTYVYVQDRNTDYPQSNLVTATYTDQSLAAVIIRDARGETVYARAVDEEGYDVPDLLATFQADIARHLPTVRTKDGFNGALLHNNIFYIIATRPILTSEGEGPAMGDITMIRKLAERGKDAEGCTVTITAAKSDADLASAIRAAEDGKAIRIIDDETIIGATLFDTLNQGKSGLLSVCSTREITQFGSTVVTYNGLVILGCILLFAITTYIALNMRFVKRLERLQAQVVDIEKAEGDNGHVDEQGSDEITDLSASINTMLSSLRESHSREIEQSLEIADNERFLNQIFNSISIGLVLVDPDTRQIVDINDSALKMARRERDEVVGNICHHLICPNERDACPILDKHQPHDMSKRMLLDRDGNRIPIMKSVSYVKQGDRILLLETIMDITEIEQARVELEKVKEGLEETVESRTRELKEANKELVALDKAKTLFLSSASHELRTPLTSILGFLKLLQKNFDRNFYPVLSGKAELQSKVERHVENLAIIRSEAERLGRLVNDLLSLNKIESGRMEWRDELIDVNDMLNHAAEASAGHSTQKEDVELIVESSDQAMSILADPDRIHQVLINLLNNAFKFTEQGHIKLAASLQGDFVRFDISDSGKGIAQADIGQVFDLFYQAHDENSRTAKQFGTGLGLAICKEIVTHYGGTIAVESSEGVGTTFSFTIPAARA